MNPRKQKEDERREAHKAPIPARKSADRPPAAPHAEEERWASRIAALDWTDLGARLTRDGCVLVPELLDAATCADLRQRFDDDNQFATTVVMEAKNYGKGVYRYFRVPIPAVVDGLRRAIYPHLARIANKWQTLLKDAERFPDQWEGFRQRCEAAGQTQSTPILLRYQAGGYNELHRDLRGSVFFPIQLAVVLSPVIAAPGQEGFRGGDFLFCDVPASKKARQRTLPAGLGDAILFCTRDRLARVGDAYGLQPVMHGVSEITEGTRVVLGVPFHEYR